jgi:hypothetical protein
MQVNNAGIFEFSPLEGITEEHSGWITGETLRVAGGLR